MKKSFTTFRRLHFALALGALVFLFSAPTARAVESLIVTTATDEDNGTSDPSAGTGTSLREAIIFANSNADLSTISFNIPEGQKVGGVWTINLTGVLPSLAHELTITGPGAMLLTVRRATSGFYRIFNTLTGSTVAISGMTVRDGRPFSGSGGGIAAEGALTLTDCVVTGNEVRGNDSGGGVYLRGNGSFTNCTFSNNSSSNNGGGIASDGALTLTDCLITGNDAAGSGGAGGGVYLAANGSFTNCTLSGNRAGNNGGGIASHGALTLTDCLITDNRATRDNVGAGGGVYLEANGSFTNCTLSGNTADNQGGAINFTGSHGRTLTLQNCTISGNTATNNGVGGGIVNVTYSGASTLQVTNCTIALNVSAAAGVSGGGIDTVGFGDGTSALTILSNNILANNTSPTLVAWINGTGAAGYATQGYNLCSDACGGLNGPGDQVNTDAQLGPLQDNGGPTPTHALTFGGPAVNTGNTTLATDQRGVSRPQAFADDKGAFELEYNESLVVTTTVDEDNGTSDPAIGAGTSLREAIKRANSDGGNSAITFDPTAFAAPRKTITLGGALLPNLASNGTLSITAPAAGVELSGNNTSGVFVVNAEANVTLNGLTIRNGNGSAGAGGAIFNSGTLLLDGCTLANNSAEAGGAIYSSTNLSGVTLTLRNCTLSGNTAAINGGAIRNERGLTILDSCTIAGNTAPVNQGSGVISFGDTVTRTEVRNSIISGNTNTDVDAIGGGNSFQSNGYNLIGDGNATGAFNQTGDVTGNADPGLAALANNGGRTQTRALLTTSPAINTGNTTLMVDQRGIVRPQPVGGAADKGAFEFNTFVESLVVTTTADENNGTSDPAFGAGTSLREAIQRANIDGVNSAITFHATAFAFPRKTISLGGTALPNLAGNGTLSITAPSAGVEISGSNARRVFLVSSGGNVTLAGLTIRNGSAPEDFGGGVANTGTLLLDGCTLVSNSALGGGAIFSQGPLTVRNCTLTGNTGTVLGGALYHGTGVTLIESSTIAGNSAPAGQGSGIASSSGSLATRTEVQNSIIADNSNTDVDFIDGTANSFQSNGHNLIGDGNATGNFLLASDQIIGNGSASLLVLDENGGRTQTRALLSGSPAIDRGDSSLSSDQRGLPRPSGLADDIGAFERQQPFFALSRKAHTGVGAFDIGLPVGGASIGVESRSGGAGGNFQMVAIAATAVVFNSAVLTSGTGTLSYTLNPAHTQITINISGVANAQRLEVSINLTDTGGTRNVLVPMGVLLGDTNGDGDVNASDIGQTKAQSGRAVTAANFHTDVTVNGAINASDIGLVKSNSGTQLPAEVTRPLKNPAK